MEEKKKLEYDDPEQSARFIETAEQLLGDDAEEKLEEAMKRIAKAKRQQKEQNKETKTHS
jgi:hypothetical protein